VASRGRRSDEPLYGVYDFDYARRDRGWMRNFGPCPILHTRPYGEFARHASARFSNRWPGYNSRVGRPAAVRRPGRDNRVEVDEFNRWIAPLNDGIACAVAGDLALTLDTPVVATTPLENFNPDYWVAIDVQRFESVRGQDALVEAVWTVHKTASGETPSGRTHARETIQGDSFEAIAAAHRRALARVGDYIATTIRAESEAKP
jgi:uncharacterized protein